MSQKIMLLAVAMASIAMFVLPAAASAQDIHLEGVTSFSGSGLSSSFASQGEPTITCESSDVEGTVAAGGTTGNISLDFTGCHTTVFGFTAKCRTSGSPIDNTIKSSGVFHLITISSGKPGMLITPVVTTIVCAGISNTVISGNVLGSVTSPACGVSSKTFSTSFTGTGGLQVHTSYTGAIYHLEEVTSGGAGGLAGLTWSSTMFSSSSGVLTCT